MAGWLVQILPQTTEREAAGWKDGESGEGREGERTALTHLPGMGGNTQGRSGRATIFLPPFHACLLEFLGLLC